MNDLEKEVEDLRRENQELRNELYQLRGIKEGLIAENKRLKESVKYEGLH